MCRAIGTLHGIGECGNRPGTCNRGIHYMFRDSTVTGDETRVTEQHSIAAQRTAANAAYESARLAELMGKFPSDVTLPAKA